MPGSPGHSPPDRLSALRKPAGDTGRREENSPCSAQSTETVVPTSALRQDFTYAEGPGLCEPSYASLFALLRPVLGAQ